MATLMVLGAGPLQLAAIDEARQIGVFTLAVDRNPGAPGLARADQGVVADIRNFREVEALAREHRVSGIMTLCTDAPVRAVAEVTKMLGLPGLDPEAAKNATDKRLMRGRFETAGVPCPKYAKVFSADAAENAAAEIGYPVVLKIAMSSGSRGVYIVNGSEELREFFAAARRYQPDGALLVEEYVYGSELSIEGFSIGAKIHIVQTTDKLLFPGPFPVEAGHTQPSRLTPKLLDEACNCAAAGVSALGLTDTAFHAEVIVNGQGARLIEIGARLGGDRITTHLTPLSTGVNMVRASIVLALGGRPDVQRTLERGSAIRYLCAPRPGILSAVQGVDALWRRVGLEFVYAASERDGALGCGFTVPAIKSSGDRYGHLIFRGDTAEEAANRAEEAVRSIRFEYAASDSDYRPNAAAANV